VNVVPDNTQCNTTTSLMTFNVQQGNTLIFISSAIQRVCSYKVQVYQFTQNDGMQQVQCLNCYLRITPAPEDLRRFEFVDSRDVVVSNLNAQTLYINRFDWNPKLILTMHDTFGNIVTARSVADLQFTYAFDLMTRGASNTLILRAGIWD